MVGSARSVSFHRAARTELLSATDWYLERSHTAASEFGAEIDHALARIREAPERYPETRYHRRRFVLLKFPFDIIYRIVKEHVEIIAVAHHNRRPGYWGAR
jgi:plasmid stabilization system protein ParE